MKSDPIQGILFTTKPVHLQQKALKRAQTTKAAGEAGTGATFYDKIGALKAQSGRIARGKTIAIVDGVSKRVPHYHRKFNIRKP